MDKWELKLSSHDNEFPTMKGLFPVISSTALHSFFSWQKDIYQNFPDMCYLCSFPNDSQHGICLYTYVKSYSSYLYEDCAEHWKGAFCIIHWRKWRTSQSTEVVASSGWLSEPALPCAEKIFTGTTSGAKWQFCTLNRESISPRLPLGAQLEKNVESICSMTSRGYDHFNTLRGNVSFIPIHFWKDLFITNCIALKWI